MFKNIKNIIEFNLRNFFKFSKKNFIGKKNVEETIEENEYFKQVFNKYFLISPQIKINVLDIGSKNFSYAKSLHNFFSKYCANLNLRGIELDTNRLYRNFYSRKAVAEYNIKNLENTKYLEGNVLEHCEKYDYITWFLPFIDENPLLKWGLPLKYFEPEKLLKHVVSCCEKKLFIINQGELEYSIQKELYKKLGIKYKDIGKIDVESNFFKYDRYLSIVETL